MQAGMGEMHKRQIEEKIEREQRRLVSSRIAEIIKSYLIHTL